MYGTVQCNLHFESLFENDVFPGYTTIFYDTETVRSGFLHQKERLQIQTKNLSLWLGIAETG